MVLELSVEKDKIVLKTRDLLSEFRKRGKRLKVVIDKAEKEIDKDGEEWLERIEQ